METMYRTIFNRVMPPSLCKSRLRCCHLGYSDDVQKIQKINGY